jgi:hypothetical protein
MIDKYGKRCIAAATLLALASTSAPAQAQSADALINKLLEKGILSTDEAKQLKTESNQNFSSAFAAKTGMPAWVKSYKFSGDFRGRFDGIYVSNDNGIDRNRLRYRLRLGVTLDLLDNFEVGLRFGTGEPVNAFGGSPVSGNQTMSGNASKKSLWVNAAYAKWTPLNLVDLKGSLALGKMENPFVFPSATVFARDYMPEGMAAQLSYNIAAKQSLKLNAGGFVLNEVGTSSTDPWLDGAQFRWDAAWNEEISTSFGVTGLAIAGKSRLANTDVPNVNRGNTRNAAGAPMYNFNPIVGDGAFTYTLKQFPGYAGKFPISLTGEYLNNPAAPDNNEAYSAGLAFGKAAKKGQWAISYRWTEIQADAWYEELLECDFGAYYQAPQANSGFTTPAYGTGSNVRGHIVRADYTPFSCFTLSLTWFNTETIHSSPAGSPAGANRIQVDGMWKF